MNQYRYITKAEEQHTPDKVYTAWELAADHWWVSAELVAIAVRGRVAWEAVDAMESGAVRLSRLALRGDGFRQFTQYVAPELKMRLIPRKEAEQYDCV